MCICEAHKNHQTHRKHETIEATWQRLQSPKLPKEKKSVPDSASMKCRNHLILFSLFHFYSFSIKSRHKSINSLSHFVPNEKNWRFFFSIWNRKFLHLSEISRCWESDGTFSTFFERRREHRLFMGSGHIRIAGATSPLTIIFGICAIPVSVCVCVCLCIIAHNFWAIQFSIWYSIGDCQESATQRNVINGLKSFHPICFRCVRVCPFNFMWRFHRKIVTEHLANCVFHDLTR